MTITDDKLTALRDWHIRHRDRLLLDSYRDEYGDEDLARTETLIAALDELVRLRASVIAISEAADKCVDDMAHGAPKRIAHRDLRLAIDSVLLTLDDAARAKAEKGGL